MNKLFSDQKRQAKAMNCLSE
uniref:Uncharacterized protein n=1 Tax=Rhizophora mucronata TaxID=61149 RepID=A0A2P2R3W4_RHIMU